MFPFKSILLLLLSFFLLLHAAFGTDLLYDICFSKDNHTSGSPGKANLNSLLSTLVSKVPRPELLQCCLEQKGAGIWYDSFEYSMAHVVGCEVESPMPNQLKKPIISNYVQIWSPQVFRRGILWEDGLQEQVQLLQRAGRPHGLDGLLWKTNELMSGLMDKAVAGLKKCADGALGHGGNKTLFGLLSARGICPEITTRRASRTP
ncbi:hypothetical protein BT93_A1522 [Corymbia citriodora subsp. variegata]|nr:hypothetical protein BT93_A1522 [Corymbia citriodora subsp. variegata]